MSGMRDVAKHAHVALSSGIINNKRTHISDGMHGGENNPERQRRPGSAIFQ
jgi:hypothetical protein